MYRILMTSIIVMSLYAELFGGRVRGLFKSKSNWYEWVFSVTAYVVFNPSYSLQANPQVNDPHNEIVKTVEIVYMLS